MEMRDFVVRFAGEGGQGVVTSAEGLAQAATQVGYHAQTFATFPSQIQGGPTWTQARIAVESILSPGDDVDVLVAFNQDGDTLLEPRSTQRLHATSPMALVLLERRKQKSRAHCPPHGTAPRAVQRTRRRG